MLVSGNKFEFESDTLREFVYETTQNGYGNIIDIARVEKSDDGRTILNYSNGFWRFEDMYFGGEPFSGISTVFCKGTACWNMVYWGMVLPHIDKKEVYACLQPALRLAPPEFPFRGPSYSLAANGLRYINIWHGDIVKFWGEEKIVDAQENLMYEAHYRGGIVNLK